MDSSANARVAVGQHLIEYVDFGNHVRSHGTLHFETTEQVGGTLGHASSVPPSPDITCQFAAEPRDTTRPASSAALR